MKPWDRDSLLAGVGLVGLMVGLTIFFSCKSDPNQTRLPDLTPQDALLAVEALEARQKAENEAIWEAIRLYHPDNDEYAKQFAKTLKEAGIPNLPGVR